MCVHGRVYVCLYIYVSVCVRAEEVRQRHMLAIEMLINRTWHIMTQSDWNTDKRKTYYCRLWVLGLGCMTDK